MSSLPTELITDILSREPIKDLLRFRCVSKPWCSLIDGPDFIELHLKRSIQTFSLSTLILKHEKLYSINLDSHKVLELDHPLLRSPSTELLGSCNGLLCLSDKENNDVALWNPSTRKHHYLPRFRHKKPYKYTTYGFGYDHVNDDYKLLRIAQRGAPAHCSRGAFETEVGIYSLKLNAWNKVGELPYQLCFKDGGVFVSGAIHFVVTPKSKLQILYLLAFDLGVEQYRLVPLPEPVDTRMQPIHVGNFAERLCLLCNWPESDIDIWVMNDYGVEASWTKLICLPPQVIRSNFKSVKPLAYSENRDAVLLWQKLQFPNCVKLHWYDLEKKTLEDANFRGVPLSFEAMSFVASLVPPFEGDTAGRSRTQGKEDIEEWQEELEDDFLAAGFKLAL